MKRFSILSGLIVLGLISSCQENSDSNDFDKDSISSEVISRYESFVAGLKSGSTEGLDDYYSEDSRFYWVEDGQVQYPNKAALMASMNGLFDSVKSTQMRLVNKKVEVFSEHSAMLFVEYEQDLVLTSGFEFSVNGAMTGLMQKEEGVWRFLIGHSSTKKQRGG